MCRCLRRLLSIKWYQSVHSAEVRHTAHRSHLTSTIQSRRLSLVGHTAEDMTLTPTRRLEQTARTTPDHTAEESS